MNYSVLLFPLLASFIHAHGYLSSPPPRGIEKVTYAIDDLKSPNHKGLCRGEPASKNPTRVQPGQSLHLGLTITAPHVGPCRVTILDANLENERPVAEKMNCAAPGGPGFWDIKLPSGLSGHYVLRWYWEGRHVSPSEPYEQCIDLLFGSESDNQYVGRGGDNGDASGRDNAGDDQVNTSTVDKPRKSRNSGTSAMIPSPPTQIPSAQSSAPSNAPMSVTDSVLSNDVSSSNEPSPTGSCAAGSYKCSTSDNGFYQCANGSWVKMGCNAGTTCRKQGSNQIICNWANQP